jgi:ABC-2 type transport system ATP-binding protein
MAVAATSPAIQASGLTKTFGKVVAVDRVDLALERGRIYGALGPNGSGKTTLIRLLTGLALPTAGYASILGLRMPSREALARIGYMTQSDGVYPELTVGENLRFFASMYGAAGGDAGREMLDLVELSDRLDTPAYELSGGLRRRLSLACALAHHPSVVFLDEPTVGVDPALRVQFWAYFRRLASDGTTLLVSSHVLDEADRCDDLVFMRAGRIIARGSGAELRSRAGTDDLEDAFLRLAGAAAESGAEDGR